jgi:hypothetical protein
LIMSRTWTTTSIEIPLSKRRCEFRIIRSNLKVFWYYFSTNESTTSLNDSILQYRTLVGLYFSPFVFGIIPKYFIISLRRFNWIRLTDAMLIRSPGASMDGDITTSKVLNIGWCIPWDTCSLANWSRGPNDESQNEQLDIGFVVFRVYLASTEWIQSPHVDLAIWRRAVSGANWKSSAGKHPIQASDICLAL